RDSARAGAADATLRGSKNHNRGELPMKSILIVDDEIELLDLFALEAEDREFETYRATTGEQAIEMARQLRPDVILMDRGLGAGRDGLEATRHLRSYPETQDLAIVILTASVMPRERAEGLASGCDHWAEKPPDYEQLFSVIEDLIRRRPK